MEEEGSSFGSVISLLSPSSSGMAATWIGSFSCLTSTVEGVASRLASGCEDFDLRALAFLCEGESRSKSRVSFSSRESLVEEEPWMSSALDEKGICGEVVVSVGGGGVRLEGGVYVQRCLREG